MLRGSAPAKIDDKGRLKVPSQFRSSLEERYGVDLFVTSVLGDSALVYPLLVWVEIEERLLAMPSTHRVRTRYLERVNYFGHGVRLDGQGRVLVSQILRKSADIAGDVVVSGQLNHLIVWNRERFEERLKQQPFTDEDFKALSDLEI